MIPFQDRFIFFLSFLYFPSYVSAAQGEAGQAWDRLTSADSLTSTAGLLGRFHTILPLMQKDSLTHSSYLIPHCSRAFTAPSPRINPSSSPKMPTRCLPARPWLLSTPCCTTPCPCQTWIWPTPAQNHPHRSLPVLSSCNYFYTINCPLKLSRVTSIKPTMVAGSAVIWQILCVPVDGCRMPAWIWLLWNLLSLAAK